MEIARNPRTRAALIAAGSYPQTSTPIGRYADRSIKLVWDGSLWLPFRGIAYEGDIVCEVPPDGARKGFRLVYSRGGSIYMERLETDDSDPDVVRLKLPEVGWIDVPRPELDS